MAHTHTVTTLSLSFWTSSPTSSPSLLSRAIPSLLPHHLPVDCCWLFGINFDECCARRTSLTPMSIVGVVVVALRSLSNSHRLSFSLISSSSTLARSLHLLRATGTTGGRQLTSATSALGLRTIAEVPTLSLSHYLSLLTSSPHLWSSSLFFLYRMNVCDFSARC